MIGAWLQRLDERLDHLGRLLPYLLTALSDEHPSVQRRALEQLDGIGALYEKDNAKDLKDVLCYLPAEAHNIVWRGTGDVWQLREAGHQLPVPSVFAARPRIGARRVVAASFGHISHALALELTTWQEEHRARATRLLATYLVFIEDGAQQFFHELVPGLCRAMVADAGDSKHLDVTGGAGRCCELMGLFAPCTAFLDVALPRVEDTSSELPLQLGALRAVAANLRGGSARTALDESAARVLAVLDATTLMDNHDASCKQGVVELLRACVAGASSSWLQDNAVQVLCILMRTATWPDTRSAACHLELQASVRQVLRQAQSDVANGAQAASSTGSNPGSVNVGVSCSSLGEQVRLWIAGRRVELEQRWSELGLDAAELEAVLQSLE
jgi:hypothetical protein